MEEVLHATVRERADAEPEAQKEVKADADKVLTQLYLKFTELWLMAPASVVEAARDLVTHFGDDTGHKDSLMAEFSRLQQLSIDTMRTDLGESV